MNRTILRGGCLAAVAAAALALPGSAGAAIDVDGSTVGAGFLTQSTGLVSVIPVNCDGGNVFGITVEVRKGKRLIAAGATNELQPCNHPGYAEVVTLKKGRLRTGTYQTTIRVTEYGGGEENVVDVNTELSGEIAWEVAP